MGKKKKKKYTVKQITIYSICFVGLIVFGIYIDKQKEENKMAEIDSGNFKTYGIVEKLKPHARKGSNYASRKDVVYLYYEKNDTIFHIIENLSDGQIAKLEIKENDCFSIRVSESDKDDFDIDFIKKLDTLIDKNHFEYQVYQTNIHKNIIE